MITYEFPPCPEGITVVKDIDGTQYTGDIETIWEELLSTAGVLYLPEMEISIGLPLPPEDLKILVDDEGYTWKKVKVTHPDRYEWQNDEIDASMDWDDLLYARSPLYEVEESGV